VAESTKSAQRPVSSETFPKTNVVDTLVKTYLQMTHWSEFRPAYLNYLDGIKVMCLDTPDVAFYRFLYSSIGKQYRWNDRLARSDEELEGLLATPGTSDPRFVRSKEHPRIH
jgi:hypothetical protein